MNIKYLHLPNRIKEVIDERTTKAINDSEGCRYVAEMNEFIAVMKRYHITPKTLKDVLNELVSINREFLSDPSILPPYNDSPYAEFHINDIFDDMKTKYVRVPCRLKDRYPDIDIELDEDGYISAECTNEIIRYRISAMDERIRKRRKGDDI